MAITLSGDSPNLTSASLTTPTLTSPTFAGTPAGVGVLTSMTAQASTSGTSIDFTSIPSWVKRVTVMFDSVSTNGTAQPLFQLGAGSVTTSGYVATSSRLQDPNAVAVLSSTAGFILNGANASNAISGAIQISNVTGNVWVAQGVFSATSVATMSLTSSGVISLSGTLDRVRITTSNGTDTFDAGSINILYE